MKNILAVDTATKILTIAVKREDDFFESIIDQGFSHSENFIPAVQDLLDEAGIKISDLDLLICTRGPGSFTGLRIGMSTLKGISCGLNIPLVSIPTLDVYAGKLQKQGVVIPVIDARKKSFYTAFFKYGNKITGDLDIPVEKILEHIENENSVLLTGPDAPLLYEKLKDDGRVSLDDNYLKGYGEVLINMGILSYKANGPDKAGQGPVYIRKSEAEIELEKKSAE